MKEDEIRGPKEIVESKALDISDEEDDESDYQTEKLRQYQFNRLKYYYAVAVFDSVETASRVMNLILIVWYILLIEYVFKN